MPRANSVQWVELHGLDLIGLPPEFAIETLHEAGLRVTVAAFSLPHDFPSPHGDRVYIYVDETQVVKEIEAQ